MKPSTSAVVDLSEDSEQNLLVTARPLLHIVKGRDAMNFCEFPLATLSDRVPGGQKTLEFEDTLKYGGKEVSRKLTITASDKYGLPTAMDDEVAFGLIQLSHAHNFAQRKVPFTRYDLIRILG